MYQNKYNNEASWSILTQVISLALLIPLVWMFKGKTIAGSLGLGGGICLIPNWYLYRTVFKHFGASQAKKILRALYVGELFKIFLTIALFFFVLSCISWALAPYVFIGYIFTQMMFWVAPVFWGIIN